MSISSQSDFGYHNFPKYYYYLKRVKTQTPQNFTFIFSCYEIQLFLKKNQPVTQLNLGNQKIVTVMLNNITVNFEVPTGQC